MARLRKRLVGVDLRERLALFQELLQPEEVSVYTLPVGGPGCVLQVPGDGAPEEVRALFVLLWF